MTSFLRYLINRYWFFGRPGAGIIHQVVLGKLLPSLENDDWYRFLYHQMLGRGLGLVANCVGGEADCLYVMAGLSLGLKSQKLIGVN